MVRVSLVKLPEESVELPALSNAERAEELIARVGSVAGEFANKCSAGPGQAHVAAPVIIGIGLANDQPSLC